ncbi:MAG: hypothetical protein OSB70_10915 [Myxococcota bacterium]|nr:hypothetical protein [Myxococcota bacterium]
MPSNNRPLHKRSIALFSLIALTFLAPSVGASDDATAPESDGP